MSNAGPQDSFDAQATLETPEGPLTYYRLAALSERGVGDIARLPFSIRILLESLLRNEDGQAVTREHVETLAGYDPASPPRQEIPYKPARVLLQDFTGVPAVVDLAAMRSAMDRLGGDPGRINPDIPVDLVIDHSVQVDAFGSQGALRINAEREFERNRERYEFLHWGQRAFESFRVVPPASGICHQVNLEYLAEVVATRPALLGAGAERPVALLDTLVGTDSHTTMINGLGVLGWGVGGIEAEAAMLGQPIYLLPPAVVGFELTGQLPEGATATDLVLTVTQMLRARGVVGQFVEFYGSGLSSMSVPDRATLANMSPEYGATMGYFPVDERTLEYLRYTGRPEAVVARVKAYCKAQGLFRTDETPDPQFSDTLALDLGDVEPSVAGPKRPQDRVALPRVRDNLRDKISAPPAEQGFGLPEDVWEKQTSVSLEGDPPVEVELGTGAVAIAAITSCTNTSNPSVMLGAGLLAQKAVEAGLRVKPWVKTSLAPGSKVVTDYLDRAGLIPALEALGFHVVGYGCTTCIGNSGPLPEAIQHAVQEHDLVLASVLSGNRNFEGRINPHTKPSYLASPPLVVAYALAGTMNIDLTSDPLGTGQDGQPVFLEDIWPSPEEVAAVAKHAMDPETFRREYGRIETANEQWNAIGSTDSLLFPWAGESTYIQHPPFFADMGLEVAPIAPIAQARVLVKVGDSITTDHISPAGAIPPDGPAAAYLREKGVERRDWNTFGSRRGNDRVMTRGTFGNIRLTNELAPGTEGGWTTHLPTGEVMSVYEAAQRYQAAGTPTLVLAGKDYGMGSSRDWAAKGTYLLGVRAVLAESFERIHRSNLVGMGVLPLQFREGESAGSLGLTGHETFTVHVGDNLAPGEAVGVDAVGEDGTKQGFTVICRIDTPIEIDYYRNGGILHTVLRQFLGG